MSMPSYQRLASERLPLANKFYKSQRSPMRVGRAEQVWVARTEDIVAACCLKPVADGQWLTALLVSPSWRQQGIASHLLRHLRAQTAGPIWLFCQPDLLPFYQRLGFVPTLQVPAPLGERLQRYRQKQPLLALLNPSSAA